MSLKSNSFGSVSKGDKSGTSVARALQQKHKEAIDKVVADARTLVIDRRKTIEKVSEPGAAEKKR